MKKFRNKMPTTAEEMERIFGIAPDEAGGDTWQISFRQRRCWITRRA